METHVSWLTQFVNEHLGNFALSLLAALHIHPSNPAMPIPEHVVMSMVVFVVGALGTLWLRSRLSVDNPGGAQQIAERFDGNTLCPDRPGESGQYRMRGTAAALVDEAELILPSIEQLQRSLGIGHFVAEIRGSARSILAVERT